MIYLEIGCFEAQSLVWMMQRVLTHSRSRAVSVDPFLQTSKLDESEMNATMEKARHNISPYSDRACIIRGNSDEVLHRMLKRGGYAGIARDSVDLCLIDGNHYSLPVLSDARLCYQLTKPGGWLLFDDYFNDIDKGIDHVKTGVELWRAEMKVAESQGRGAVKEVWRSKYMVCFEKVS